LLNIRSPERQDLIGAKNIATGMTQRDKGRLPLGEQGCDLARRLQPGFLLDAALVDIRRHRIKRNASIRQQLTTRQTLRRQDQWLHATPNGHSDIL
jgi:hypothetical protein